MSFLCPSVKSSINKGMTWIFEGYGLEKGLEGNFREGVEGEYDQDAFCV